MDRKYGNTNVWEYFCEVFDYLPISAVIECRIFCVHAGMAPEITTLDQINAIERVGELPSDGAYYNLLWSDLEEGIEGWHGAPRGSG